MGWLIGLWVVAFAAQAALLGANMWGLVVLSDLEVEAAGRERDGSGVRAGRRLGETPSPAPRRRHHRPLFFSTHPTHLFTVTLNSAPQADMMNPHDSAASLNTWMVSSQFLRQWVCACRAGARPPSPLKTPTFFFPSSFPSLPLC